MSAASDLQAKAVAAMKGLPLQPIKVSADGIVRFSENRIVTAFWKAGADGRRLNLNDIAIRAARGEFSKEEQMQFAQLIGYSVSGFGDLSYSDKRVVQYADDVADHLPNSKVRTKKSAGNDKITYSES